MIIASDINTMTIAERLAVLASAGPDADTFIAEMRINQITSYLGGQTPSTTLWHGWCRTRGIPDNIRGAHEQRIHQYYRDINGWNLVNAQVASRALSGLDVFFLNLAGPDLNEQTLAPVTVLNWIHTFRYTDVNLYDESNTRLAQWHRLHDRGWVLAAAGFTPSEYLTAAANGLAPTEEDAKVLAALRGYHFLPEPDQT